MSVNEKGRYFIHRAEYLALRITAWWINILPLRLALVWGSCLGWFAWSILGVRKKVSLINLRQAFPDWSTRKMNRIGLASYRNAGRFMMEFIRQKKVDDSYFDRYIEWENPDQRELIESLDTGIIDLSFHHGNWELLGIIMKRTFSDVAFLVGEQHNGLVDDHINDLRSSHGIEIYTRDAALRGVIASIRRKGMVMWLSDQDAGRNGLVVDFLGYPASTPRGAAAFAVKLNVPIWCIFLEREKGPYQKLFASELLYPRMDLPTTGEAELELTQRYTRILEKRVRKRPDLYWWAHRRWKTTGLYRKKKEGQE